MKLSFKEKVAKAAKSRGLTLKSLYPHLGYDSYTGFLKGLEKESIKGPALDKLIEMVGPLNPGDKVESSSVTEAQKSDNNRLDSCLKEVSYLKEIIELKDKLLSSYEKLLAEKSST